MQEQAKRLMRRQVERQEEDQESVAWGDSQCMKGVDRQLQILVQLSRIRTKN